MKSVKRLLVFLVSILVVRAVVAEPVRLAHERKALLPIYVGSEASADLQELAAELAGYLSRISGGEFSVVSERPQQAIFLGTRAMFPEMLSEPEAIGLASARERYRIRTDQGSLIIVGETDRAVEDAVFDLLHELGYRQFFPTSAWEVVPHNPDLAIEIDRVSQPAFARRFIFIAVRRKPVELVQAVDFPETEAAFADWQRKNRAVSGYQLNSGHAYQEIIKRNSEVFAAHPEWLTNKDTWADSGSGLYAPKFMVDNDELRKVVQNDALAWLRAHPEADTPFHH